MQAADVYRSNDFGAVPDDILRAYLSLAAFVPPSALFVLMRCS